jgi:NAD-dependent deacetylase
MHGELFKSRCDSCALPPFDDVNLYESPTEIPRCSCGGRIRPHICWFGETPFHLDEILAALDQCTFFLAIGTSGTVEPAASLAARAKRRAKTIYVGPEPPANRYLFDDLFLGNSGELLPMLFSF